MLEVQKLNGFYGLAQVLRDISLHVDTGEAVAVLGPNGAGKSSLLRCISGLSISVKGSIKYNGHEITGETPHAIVKLGIVQVPEGRRIFEQLSVQENLMMGAFTRGDHRAINDDLHFVFSIFPDLERKKGQRGGELSGGQQQMLAVGRALMSRPTLLLLDEPSLGLSPIMVDQLGESITKIREDLGMSVMLVEQNAGLAMEMASRVYVMQTGRVVLSSSTEDVTVEQIGEAYLGQPTTA